MDDLMNLERLHPFAFVNMRRGEVGTPYKIGQYEKAHAAAVKRIGMQVSKELGTTPHGHRHAYGRRLSNAGIEPVMIKRVMHHASIESQLVYTQPTLEEIHEMLKRAMSTLTPERGVLDEQIMKRVIASSP
jgi:integrase